MSRSMASEIMELHEVEASICVDYADERAMNSEACRDKAVAALEVTCERDRLARELDAAAAARDAAVAECRDKDSRIAALEAQLRAPPMSKHLAVRKSAHRAFVNHRVVRTINWSICPQARAGANDAREP